MFGYWALPSTVQLVCWLLTGMIAALLVGGFALSPYDAGRGGRMTKITELPQSALLIVIAAMVWASPPQSGLPSTLAMFILGGIGLGFIGDLFMANVFKQKDHVLYGMAAFAIGHLFYMLAFREIALAFGMNDLRLFALAIVSVWIVGAVVWFVMIRNPKQMTVMHYAALGYILFLGTMAGLALGLALHHAAFIPLAIGAVLFLLSDALIAANLFSGLKFPYHGDLVWLTYIIAQVLIVTVVPTIYALKSTG